MRWVILKDFIDASFDTHYVFVLAHPFFVWRILAKLSYEVNSVRFEFTLLRGFCVTGLECQQ